MDENELRQRRAQLEARRQEIMAQANMDIGFVNGQLALIDELLAKADGPEREDDPAG
jgi:hypothetical protein